MSAEVEEAPVKIGESEGTHNLLVRTPLNRCYSADFLERNAENGRFRFTQFAVRADRIARHPKEAPGRQR